MSFSHAFKRLHILIYLYSFSGLEASLPEAPVVAHGEAKVLPVEAKTLQIEQKSAKAIINWHSFSIDSGHTVKITQPSSSSILLNRVTGPDPSVLRGNLIANGNVWLVNRNGVMVGDGVRLDVNGFMATTKDIRDEDFVRGHYHFQGDSIATIRLEGRIERAVPGKWMVLAANKIENEAVLLATPCHKIVLGGVEAFSLDLDGDRLVEFSVDKSRASQSLEVQLATHSRIEALDSQVLLTTQDTEDTVRNVINMEGVVLADRAEVEADGSINLIGGEGSNVVVSGQLQARGHNTTGGIVKVTGEVVSVEPQARIDVSGDKGGGKAFVGADIRGKSLRPARKTVVKKGAEIHADALERGNGGQIDFWGEESLSFKALATARGGAFAGNGGFIETSVRVSDLDIEDSQIITLAPHGEAGMFWIDPATIYISRGFPAFGAVTIAPDTIQGWLSGGNVTLSTADYAGGVGDNTDKDIIIQEAFNFDSPHNLTLEAGHDIIIGASSTYSGSGNLYLKAGMDANNGVLVQPMGVETITHTGSGKVFVYYASNGPLNFNPMVTSPYIAYRWIKDLGEWQAIAAQWNVFNSTYSYALRTDLVLQPADALPQAQFSGYFDGNGHSITFQRNTNDDLPCLFHAVNNPDLETPTIQNLTLNYGSYINPPTSILPTGALIRMLNNGYIYNNVINIDTLEGTSYVGGIAGSFVNGKIAYNTISANTIQGIDHIGGIVGENQGVNTGNINNNTVEISGSLMGGSYVGGICAFSNAPTPQEIFNNNLTINRIQGNTFVGGLVAELAYGGVNNNTLTAGAIVGLGEYVGGAVGRVNFIGCTLQSNTINAPIIQMVGGSVYTGGIAGWLSNQGGLRFGTPFAYSVVSNNQFNNAVIGPISASIGGLFGQVSNVAAAQGGFFADAAYLAGTNTWIIDAALSGEQQALIDGGGYKRATKHIGSGDFSDDPNNALATWNIQNGTLRYVVLQEALEPVLSSDASSVRDLVASSPFYEGPANEVETPLSDEGISLTDSFGWGRKEEGGEQTSPIIQNQNTTQV